MIRKLVFDVEAIPTSNPVLLEKFREESINSKPKHNTRKALKESWDTDDAIDGRYQDLVRKTSLNPLYAEPILIHVYVDNTHHTIDCFDGENIMEKLYSWVGDNVCLKTIWYGYNSSSYDLFLLRNSFIKMNIPVPELFPVYESKRYWSRSVDVMKMISDERGVSMDNASLSLLGYGAKTLNYKKQAMCGALVWDAYKEKEFKLLHEYCKQDVVITNELIKVLNC